jgi:hypothetical protein
MKSKVSRKNKKGAGPEYQNSPPDIENQLENARYEYTPDIENQLNKETTVSTDTYITDTDIDKPKNIVEYVPEQSKTFVEPIEQDVEINIPSNKRIDLGDSGYGVFDDQFYGGRTKKRRRGRKNKTKRKKNKKSIKVKKIKNKK